MELTKSVLVVIDMQNGFISSKSAHIVPRVVDLVQRWMQLGGSTVFTRFINHAGSPFERLINWTRMRSLPEIDLVAEVTELSQQAVAVLDKPIYSAFTPEGSALIDQHGWTDLVLCGVATESCVLKTACDAFERGLTPWIVTDACHSHGGEEPHEAGLLVARRFIGRSQLVSTDELFLTKRAPTE